MIKFLYDLVLSSLFFLYCELNVLLLSICRILCAGVIPPRVKTGVHAGSRVPHTLASARLGGLGSIATSLACLARWQLNVKVHRPTPKLLPH